MASSSPEPGPLEPGAYPNFADWYWKAGDGRVFSSRLMTEVGEGSEDYAAWTSAGGVATDWPMDEHGEQTQAALDAVLAARGLKSLGDPEKPPAPIVTYKADLYRRATEDEAEAIEMALAQASVRDRRLFESAQYLDHADPVFARMREALVGMFQEARADELLAPSQA